MRKAFDPQRRLDCPSVTAVPLNLNCRHEIIPILRALQHIYSLIGDGLGKVLSLVATLAGLFGLEGWRQHKHLWRKAKRLIRKIERIAARKGNDYQQRIKKPYRKLLDLAETVLSRADTLRETVRENGIPDAEARALDKESAIGALESANGLERCRDRTEGGFARYVGLGVLGRNLHVLGKLLIARESPHCQAAFSGRQRAA